VRLSSAQRDWLARAGDRERPSLDAGDMLVRVLDEAMLESDREADRREYQLEIYRASGYSEHHPDYPNLRAVIPDE
jgi:hypothetical protein